MSLSNISGGGLGGGVGSVGGGLATAAHANNAALANPAAQVPPPGAEIPGGSGGPTGAPVSIAALGADLVDKNQTLSMKQVRNTARLPLVGIDLYANDPIVSMFPPKPKEPDQTLKPTLVGKIRPQVCFHKTEAAHKALRKFLNKDKTYESLLADSIAPAVAGASGTDTDGKTVTLLKPQQWLGLRRLEDAPAFWKDGNVTIDKASMNTDAKSARQGTTAMISEESVIDGVTITNGTLDGVSAPSGDDFDRVVYKVRLAENKKALTLLPEEATSLVVANAQYHVAKKTAGTKSKGNDDDEEEDPLDYPVAVALPGWVCHDASLDAWVDVVSCGAFFQRSVAALAGALVPGVVTNKPNALMERINAVTQALWKAHEKKNDGTSFDYKPLVVMVGVASDGIECTAIQVSETQHNVPSCLYGNFKVLTSMAIPHADPLSQMDRCVRDLYDRLDEVAPEVEGPVAFVTYGSSKPDQAKMQASMEKIRSSLDTWEKVPIIPIRTECVSVGTAILGGVSHGRVTTLTQNANKKPKAQMAIRVQNVATCAVGVRMSYKPGVWTDVKTIFDFDRRVPAGPYSVELKASECVAIREAGKGVELSDEAMLKATKEAEGAKGIPKREAAALDFQIQVVQKWTRDGEWVNVADPARLLTKPDDDNSDDDSKRIACESVTLELKMSPTGMISQTLVGDLYVT